MFRDREDGRGKVSCILRDNRYGGGRDKDIRIGGDAAHNIYVGGKGG